MTCQTRRPSETAPPGPNNRTGYSAVYKPGTRLRVQKSTSQSALFAEYPMCMRKDQLLLCHSLEDLSEFGQSLQDTRQPLLLRFGGQLAEIELSELFLPRN